MRLRGRPEPLPLGEVSAKQTERASPARKSRRTAKGRLFVRAILSLCKSCLAASLPSQALRASSPKGGASGETVHFAGTAKASPTRGGGSASALTERLYEDGPALGSSLVNLPPRLSPQNAKPPRSCDLPGGFFLRESPQNLREWQLHRGGGVL